jgi:hypothetical protein
MNRRYQIYLGVIAFLVLVILGRLWLNSGKVFVRKDSGEAAHGVVFLPEDFKLHVDFYVANGPHRDLFQAQGGTLLTHTEHARPATVKAAKLLPANPAQTGGQPADSALGQFKLLGVVFRGGKGQVYLASDRDSVMAHAGDTVLGQFAVDKVAVDAVELRDLKTNTIRRIPVSGK